MTDDTSTRVRTVAATRAGAELTHPFRPGTDVWKVGGKVFATIGSDPPLLTAKADPEDVTALVEQHDGIERGYHMDKRHWVSAALDGSVPADLLTGLVEDSYRLVVDGLPAADRPPA